MDYKWLISHYAFIDASVKPLCQGTGPHPNALEKCLMNTPTSTYILEGTHPVFAIISKLLGELRLLLLFFNSILNLTMRIPLL